MAGDPGVPHDAGVAEARERVRVNRELELEDRHDRGLAEQVLRSELGEANFTQGKRMLEQHLAKLPAHERMRIQNATTRDGTPALSDPTTLKALANEALGPMPRTRAAAETEIAEMKTLMANRKSKYWQGNDSDRLQLRYRQLLSATQGSK